MEIKITTLTPIWTGGVEAGKMDRIHETGIIGSLRWWYEVIVRGVGGRVCNPTSDKPNERCQFDSEGYNKALKDGKDLKEAIKAGLKNVCVVCRLFGCTGWKRRFNIAPAYSTELETPFWLATLNEPNQLNHWWLSQVFKIPNNSRVVTGDIRLKFTFARGYEYNREILRALLTVMSNFGALGAKSQYGFGIFSFPDANKLEEAIAILKKQVESVPETESSNTSTSTNNFYTLQNFWSLQCQVSGDDPQIKKFQGAKVIGDKQTFQNFKKRLLPVSFDIRYKLPGQQDKGLRQDYRTRSGKEATRKVFGTVISEEQKWGSRIFVSHLYQDSDSDANYQLRVWGFTDTQVCDTVENAVRAIFENCEIRRKNGQDILTTTEVVE